MITTLAAGLGAAIGAKVYSDNGGSGLRGALLGAMAGGAIGWGISQYLALKSFTPLRNILLQGLMQGTMTLLGVWASDRLRSDSGPRTNFDYFDKFMTGFAFGAAAAAFTSHFGLDGAVAGASLAAVVTALNDIMDAILAGETINWSLVGVNAAIAFITTMLANPYALSALGRSSPPEIAAAWRYLDEGGSTSDFISWLWGGVFSFSWGTLFGTISDLYGKN